jgi:hypothetical protein
LATSGTPLVLAVAGATAAAFVFCVDFFGGMIVRVIDVAVSIECFIFEGARGDVAPGISVTGNLQAFSIAQGRDESTTLPFVLSSRLSNICF